jgi:transposase
LEDLTHIRKRITVQPTQRARHSNWAFWQMRQFISYKAALQSVPVLLVDPRNTSRSCNVCGCYNKRNRPGCPLGLATFRCVSCGHTSLADVNAALNIRDRAGVMLPLVSDLRVQMQAVGL